MDCGEDNGTGSSAALQLADEYVIRLVGIGRITVLSFLGEGIGIEPVKQLSVAADTPESKLRSVEVQIS